MIRGQTATLNPQYSGVSPGRRFVGMLPILAVFSARPGESAARSASLTIAVTRLIASDAMTRNTPEGNDYARICPPPCRRMTEKQQNSPESAEISREGETKTAARLAGRRIGFANHTDRKGAGYSIIPPIISTASGSSDARSHTRNDASSTGNGTINPRERADRKPNRG